MSAPPPTERVEGAPIPLDAPDSIRPGGPGRCLPALSHRRPRRPRGIALLALGAAVVAGLTLTLAVTTDTADTGTNQVDSETALPAMLQISSGSAGPAAYNDAAYGNDCDVLPPGGGYVDDQTAEVTLAPAAVPQTMAAGGRVLYLCLKNLGGSTVTIDSTSVQALTDTETGCSAGEAAVDGSCGSGAGETSSEIRLELYLGPGGGICKTPGSGENVETHVHDGISDSPTDTWSVTIGAGDTRCAVIAAVYLDTLTTPTEQTANRSDATTFKIRYGVSG